MRKIGWISLVSAVAGLTVVASLVAAAPTIAPVVDLASGWQPLHEGNAQGQIEQDAVYPTHPSQHLLRITETKAADPGEGRVGAVSDIHFSVDEGQWCDVTFSAVTAGASIGLVFSLENSDGKVLARTTLPEIGGRGRRRGGPATAATTAPAAPVAWRKYRVSLHARASDPTAHVVISPIEPTDIWIDGLILTPRQAAK
jgi:hypothetical protein